MVRVLLASLALVAAAEPSFEEWQVQTGRVYNSDDENAKRKTIYDSNVKKIQAHNAKNLSSTHAVNDFADLTSEEFMAQYASGVPASTTPQEDTDQPILEVDNDGELEIASSLDWCTKGACNSIQTQRASDCWAFSTAAATEGAAKAHLNFLPKLSEQQMVDCSGAGSAANGGWPHDAYSYLARGHGFCSGASYKYAGRDGNCQESRCTSAVRVTGVKKEGGAPYPGAVSAASMRNAVSTNPVSVYIASSDMQFHGQGVITTSCTHGMDHAITAVGYGTLSGQDYFKIRNSWGSGWGEQGYARIGASGSGGEYPELGASCILQYGFSYPVVSSSSEEISV